MIALNDREYMAIWSYGGPGNVPSPDGDWGVEFHYWEFFENPIHNYTDRMKRLIRDLKQGQSADLDDPNGTQIVVRLL